MHGGRSFDTAVTKGQVNNVIRHSSSTVLAHWGSKRRASSIGININTTDNSRNA